MNSNENVALTNPDHILAFRLFTLIRGARLEALGMRRKGESCLSILKRELNIKGKASKHVIAEAEKRHAILVAQWSKKPAPVSK